VNFRTSDGQNNVKKVTFSGSDIGVDFDVVTDPVMQIPVVRVKKVSTSKNPTAYITIEPFRGSTNVTSARAFIAIPLGTVPPPKGKDTKEKEKEKEFKEFKEKDSDGKDFRKDSKDNREGKDLFEFSSTGVIQPMERLARLEGAVDQLMHFISPELRPDLNAGALKGELEHSSDDRVALSQLLQKQASDAKQAKDTKDVEKPRER
jgi:hypothetical protein